MFYIAEMGKARNVLACIVLILVGAALLFLIQSGSELRLRPSENLTSADFVTIVLTALGVILAALALFIGGLAIIGWATFEERLKQHSEGFLSKRFSSEDERYVDLVKTLKEDVLREVDLRKAKQDEIENESPFDPDAV